MAPLTWRNVNAPDFSSSARILGDAGRGLGDGFDSISGVFKDARERQINTRSNEGIGQLAGATNESDVERIMAQVLGSVSARDRNGALNNAIMGSSGRAIGLEGGRADIRNTENMISNRNAASGRAAAAAGRAATLAERQTDEYLRKTATEDRLIAAGKADQLFAQGLAQDNPALVEERLPTSPGSLRQVVPPSVTAPVPTTSNTPASPEKLENPTQDGLPNAGVTGAIVLDGGTGEDTIRDGDSNTVAMDKALQSIMDGAPVTPEILTTIQGGYSEDTRDPVVGSQRPDQIQAQDEALASVSSTIPSVAQVDDGEVIAEPIVQAKIDEVIEANTDTETGQPASPEATEQMGRSIYELMLETGVELTPEEVYGHIAKRQASINAGTTKKQKAYNDEVKDNLRNELKTRGADGAREVEQLIRNNPDISTRDRNAYLTALKEFTAEDGLNADYFKGVGTATLLTAEGVADHTENMALIKESGNLAKLMDLDSQNMDADGNEIASKGLTSAANALVEASGGELQLENVMSTVQEFQQESKLPYHIIIGGLKNSLTGNWLNTKAVLSKDIMRRNLSPYLNAETGEADPAAIEQAQSASRAQRNIGIEADILDAEINKINEDFRVLSSRQQGPEVKERIVALRVRREEIKKRIGDLRTESKSLFEPPKVTDEKDLIIPPPGGDMKDPDTQFKVPPGILTPDGNEVREDGSKWGRAWNQMNADNEVRSNIGSIRTKLAVNGASPISRLFGSFFDGAQPKAEADADSALRAEKEVIFDWYGSNEAAELFFNNPTLSKEAKEDPIAFYKERMKNQ
jgi:hypothetical protein